MLSMDHVYPPSSCKLLTIAHPLFTVQEISADSGWIVAGSKRVLQGLDQFAEVLESLKDLYALVQHGQVHILIILGWTRTVNEEITIALKYGAINDDDDDFTYLDM